MSDVPREATTAESPAIPGIILANRGQFLGFLERRLGGRDAAEEVLQAAYLKALDKGRTLSREESAVAWFYRLLRNSIVDRKRRLAAEERALERHGQEVSAEAEPEDAGLEAAVCACVDALVPTLKPEYAEIIQQVDLRGAGIREVADEAGITANNASVRLHRARAALRRQLELTCGACTEHGCLDCTCSHAGSASHHGAREDGEPV